MSLLRDRLKADCPDLWHALERSWDTAITRWLPKVDAKSVNSQGEPSESFNSFPHLKNLETHLDRVITAYERYLNETTGSSEAFILSPVEIYSICSAILFHDMGRIKGEKNHGRNTRKILLDKEQYAVLGIPSRELAEPIGLICEFHTAIDSVRLSTMAVHPYGVLRCRELGALLLLIDEMDDTFNRTLLECLKVKPDIKAEFRRIIREVYVDPRRQTIFTVLDSKDDIYFRIHMKVLGDKLIKLGKIKSDLARLGVLISGWRLEHDEHLFDENGLETYEACFYPGYLEEVVTQMWQLSTQVFGAAAFTYENLAAAMRERDIEKVRIAVRRIAILMQGLCGDNKHNIGVWAGTDQWKWLMCRYESKARNGDTAPHCRYVPKSQIVDVLRKAEKNAKKK